MQENNASIIVIMEICKAPTLRAKALNKHNMTLKCLFFLKKKKQERKRKEKRKKKKKKKKEKRKENKKLPAI